MTASNTLRTVNEACREILQDHTQKGEIFRKTFSKCTSDKQRVKILMWSYFKDVEYTFEAASGKNKRDSLQYKEDGNTKYKKKEFGEAIKLYNKSLAFAPVGRNTGQEAALAYANRSAVLFHLKKYEACLQDVHRALQVGYPAIDRYKLVDRHAKCLSRLGRPEEARLAFSEAVRTVEFSKLEGKAKKMWIKKLEAEIAKGASEEEEAADSYSLTKKPVEDILNGMPRGWKTDCLQIERSDEKGRHLLATRDIKVGEVIIYEKTPVGVLAEKYYDQFCYHCLGLLLNPLPCPVCTRVYFCSDACRDTGLKRYHLEECMSLEQYGRNTDAGGKLPTISQVALRCLLTMSGEDYEGVDILGSADGTSEVSIFTLMSHNNDRDLDQKLLFTLVALQGAITLKGSPYWSKLLRRREESESDLIILIATFLLHFLGATVCNSFQVSCYEFDASRDFRQTDLLYIGVCLCPFVDMANHSCSPTADVEFYGTNCVVTATAPIKSGDEMNVDYGPHYSEVAKHQRQQELLTKFFFSCQCAACAGDWPTAELQEERTARFRCELCRAEITEPASDDGALACPGCPHAQSMYTICEVLAESHAAYDHVMKRTKQAGVETLIAVLEQHITLLDYWICLPWKDHANCQATLKQLYRCMGNHFYASDKLW